MEQEILQLLRNARGQAFSLKEIGKIIDRQQFREEPNWARPFVNTLVCRQMIEKNDDGRYFAPAHEATA